MIYSFTPSGVEHMNEPEVPDVPVTVIHSFTPSGVEHLLPKRLIDSLPPM